MAKAKKKKSTKNTRQKQTVKKKTKAKSSKAKKKAKGKTIKKKKRVLIKAKKTKTKAKKTKAKAKKTKTKAKKTKAKKTKTKAKKTKTKAKKTKTKAKKTKTKAKKTKTKAKPKSSGKSKKPLPKSGSGKAGVKASAGAKVEADKKKGTEKKAVKTAKKNAGKKATIVVKKTPMPVLKIILCGPHSVYWIAKDVKINQSIFDEGLHKDELALSKEMKSTGRKQEFLRARWLHHRVSKSREPLLRDPHGIPTWPEGVVNSISHKSGHVVYCTSKSETHHGLGVDMESISSMKTELSPKICVPSENDIIDRVEALGGMSRSEVLTLIFAFKEAIYKTYFPLGKTFFGFHDATIIEIAYDRREIMAKINIETSSYSPAGHEVLGFYNWVEHDDEKYVVVVAEERKPMPIEGVEKPSAKKVSPPPKKSEAVAGSEN